MQTSFQEFLRQKTEGTGIKDRKSKREEWLAALARLFDQIRDWLREADTDDLLEIVPYEVERVEERLGVHDAPALKIRLGTDAVNVVPVGRYSMGPISFLGFKVFRDGLAAGRVDITNGERKYMLFRSIEQGEDHWFVVKDVVQAEPFDKDHLEAIIRDLMS